MGNMASEPVARTRMSYEITSPFWQVTVFLSESMDVTKVLT